jgi:predicted metal-dependent hydrolase
VGEIKSTLDLIMEKTRHLSMSPEEKEENRRQEWLKKARGWIQKFLDDLVDMDRVKSEFRNQELPSGWEKFLKKELIDGLEPEADNEKRFQLLKELLGIPPDGFINILEGHRQRLAREKEKRMALMKSQLSNRGISGTAVIPNPEVDPAWKKFYEQAGQAFKEELSAL